MFLFWFLFSNNIDSYLDNIEKTEALKKTSSSSSNSSLENIDAKNENDIITVEVTNHVTKSDSSSDEEDLPNMPKSQGSLNQDKVGIILDPSMIPPEHDDKHPIVGGIAVCFKVDWFNSYWPIRTNPDTSKKIEPPETYAGVFYGPTGLIYEETWKFELGGKKVHFVLKTVLFTSNWV